ncbi:cupin domain-containing protein [Dokdonella sp.]|uniref:cupin domain-containing protein n=1 Tax=Dokdonella sp. TaxID=2291710 RepID=UPI001B067A43|nr:cupin domain-containing protein [Dokdonella sp.]MBO9662430.1 cupin domain-containing protein [Dokdonella sp.]
MPTPPAIETRADARHLLGMPAARFLRDYWQKRPLLIRGAFAGFRNPVAPEDLAGLACEELALSRIVIEHRSHDGGRGGARAGASRWELRNGPFAEADFAELPKTHWTLLVQDVDKWDADVAALLPHFAFLPSWRIDDVMISYAEDGGSVGAHVDQYDVFLLQGLGRRRWQISTDASASKEFRTDAELKLLREFVPTHEWVLEPGDMLYLPPGVPHHGVALGACMTYSIGMRAPSQAELLVDFAETLAERIPDSSRLGDPDLAPSRGDGEIDDAAIARVTAAMPWLLIDAGSKDEKHAGSDGGHPGKADASLLRTWFGRFITRYRSAQSAAPNPRRLSDAAFARAFEQGARVRRNPWSRSAWMREGRGARLFVAGDAHACSVGFARLVCTGPEFALADVPKAAGDRDVLRALIDAGHLALLRSSRRGNRA